MACYVKGVNLCSNDVLRAILVQDRDEDKEHGAMDLERIRGRDPSFDEQLKDYLFTEKQITYE